MARGCLHPAQGLPEASELASASAPNRPDRLGGFVGDSSVSPCDAQRGETGRFGADRQVELVNDSPVTFLVVARGGALARET